MTVTYVDGVTAVSSASSATATIPSDILSGHLMLLAVTFKLRQANGTITTPTGWTLAGTGIVDISGGAGQVAVYKKIATGTDGGSSLNVTATGTSQELTFALAAWAGSNGTVRNSGYADNGLTASTSITCGAQTAAAGDQVVLIGGDRGSVNGAFTHSPPAGFAQRQSTSIATGSAQNMGSFIADGTATGAQTVTASVAVWSLAGQFIIEAAVQATPDPLTAGTSLSVTTTGVGEATGALTAAASLSAAATSVQETGSALTAGTSLSAAATGVGEAAPAPLTAASSLGATAQRVIQLVPDPMTASSTISCTAAGVGITAVTVTAASTMSAATNDVHEAAVTLTAATSTTVTATGTAATAIALTAGSQLTATPQRITEATAALTATSSTTLTAATSAASTAVALTAGATLTTAAISLTDVAVTLTAATSLTVGFGGPANKPTRTSVLTDSVTGHRLNAAMNGSQLTAQLAESTLDAHM